MASVRVDGTAIARIFVFHAVICSAARGVGGRVAVNGCAAVRFIIFPYRRKSLNLVGSPCIHHRRTSSGTAVSCAAGGAGGVHNKRTARRRLRPGRCRLLLLAGGWWGRFRLVGWRINSGEGMCALSSTSAIVCDTVYHRQEHNSSSPRRAGRLSLTIFNGFRLGGFHRTDDPRWKRKITRANQYAPSAPCHRRSRSALPVPIRLLEMSFSNHSSTTRCSTGGGAFRPHTYCRAKRIIGENHIFISVSSLPGRA